jgi:hypothetical protein
MTDKRPYSLLMRDAARAVYDRQHPDVMTPATIDTMPNQEKTPRRTVRVESDLWLDAQAAAAVEGITISDVIRSALEAYVKKNRKKAEK